jgi:hypothetical protein
MNFYSYVNGESGMDDILTTKSHNFDKENTSSSATNFVKKT